LAGRCDALSQINTSGAPQCGRHKMPSIDSTQAQPHDLVD
jgi:hypothetical protein